MTDVATTGGGVQPVATGGPGGQLEVGTLTTADARRYYADMSAKVAAMAGRLDGLGENGTLCVEEYRQVAAGCKTIAHKLEASAAAMRREGLDPKVVAEGERLKEQVVAMAATATRGADAIEAAIRKVRTELQDKANQLAAGATQLVTTLTGYKPSEDAIQSSPLQPPTMTRVLMGN